MGCHFSCFPRGSSQPKAQIHVSCNSRQILYHWTTREAQAERELKNKIPIPFSSLFFSSLSPFIPPFLHLSLRCSSMVQCWSQRIRLPRATTHQDQTPRTYSRVKKLWMYLKGQVKDVQHLSPVDKWLKNLNVCVSHSVVSDSLWPHRL